MRAVWLTALLSLPMVVQAQSVQQAQQQSSALTAVAVDSQQRIDQLDDATRSALETYRQANQQISQLGEYNSRMEKVVAQQQQELASLQEQLGGIEHTQAEMRPLIRRMVESLEQFIAVDLPFLPEEREDRVARLQDLLVDPEVSIAELYRRVLEAYQIESDYGRTLEAWRGELVQGGDARVVEFLRLGRLMLFYQTLDGQEQGYWDSATRSWQALPGGYRRTLDQGLAIARTEQMPVMLRLPLPAVSQEVTP
jgi:ABC-type transporter Mla subunit MlaD